MLLTTLSSEHQPIHRLCNTLAATTMAPLVFSTADFLAAFHLIQSATDALQSNLQEHGSVVTELQGYKQLLQYVQDFNADDEESRAVVSQLQTAVMQNQQVIRNLWRQHQRNQGIVVDGTSNDWFRAFQQSYNGFAQDPLEILEVVVAGENRNLRLLIASKLCVCHYLFLDPLLTKILTAE
jgi:hypothetical protein